MEFSSFPDIFSWIQNLPPIHQWETSSKSLNLCPSCSSHPSLKLSLTNLKNTLVSLSITADYNLPIPLWTSKKFSPNPISKKLLDHDDRTVSTMLTNFIEDVLKYCSNKAGPSGADDGRANLNTSLSDDMDLVIESRSTQDKRFRKTSTVKEPILQYTKRQKSLAV